MGVSHAWNRGNAVAQLLGNGEVVGPVIAHGAHVDLRWDAEIEDLGDDISRL